MSAAARAIPILLSMSICWRDTKGTASARRGRAPPCTRWIFPELANSRRSRRIVSSETLYRLLRSAARTRPSLPSSSRMYWWRSSFRAIWPASDSGFIVPILHEYNWLCTYIRVSSDLCMILPNLAPYIRSFTKAFGSGSRLRLRKRSLPRANAGGYERYGARVHWEDPGVVEQPDNRKIERDYLRSRSPHPRKIRQVAYHRHCVSTLSHDLLLQVVEFFAVASYQDDITVLDHFQRRSSAYPRGRADNDIRLVIVHRKDVGHGEAPVMSVWSVIIKVKKFMPSRAKRLRSPLCCASSHGSNPES